MDLTGKAKKYVSKKLRQKRFGKNISQRRPVTMQEVMAKANSNKGKPMASSPYSNLNSEKLSVQKANDPKYKSEFEWLFDPVRGVQWDYNPVQLREMAQDDAYVQMLVNNMTRELANMPWQIVKDDDPEVSKSENVSNVYENLNPFERVAKGVTGKQPDSDNVAAKEAEKFFRKPNPDEDFSTFTEQIVADMLEVGSLSTVKMFAESDYDGEQLVSNDPELIYTKPSDPVTWTKEYKNKHGFVTGYWQYDSNSAHRQTLNSRRSGRTDPTRFSREEVGWKDLHSRSNRRYGLPPTLAVRDFLMLIDLTIQQEQDYWARGAFPAGFIKSNGDIEEIEFLKDETQGEQGRQGGIMHISDDEADFVQMAYNWKDMDVNERMDRYQKVIAASFQVPTSVVGLSPDKVNYNTFQGERDNFESNSLGPYAHDLERFFTEFYIKPHFSENLRFEFVPGMSENQKSSISDRVNKEFNNNLITRNEARTQLGYEKTEEDGFIEDVTEEQEQPNLQEQLQLSSFNKQGNESDCGCCSKENVGKPFGPWEDFDDCISYMTSEQDYDKETAQQVCGSLQAELKDKDLEKMSKSEAKLEIEKAIEKILVDKQESFTDYPDAASENAQMALDAKEETGDPNDCGTDVGWARANQLADREPISLDTVKRMSQFERHEDNKEMGEEGRADCGWMMWKAWGGDEGIRWADQKVDEVESEDEEKTCDQCNKDISKSDNKRFCSKKCYNKYLSKDDNEPLRSDEEYFKYDFQPRHVEQFKEELQEPIRQSLNSIFQNDRFNQVVERFAEQERNDNTAKNSAELRRILNELIKDAAMTKTMEQVINDQSSAIAVTALEDQIADTGLDADIDEVTKRLQNRKLNFVENFSQRMEEDIRNTVSQGWQEGQSIQEIQENLQAKADDLSDNQAERIARDQLQRATGEARNEFASQHSDKFVEVWNAVGDNRTREAHSEMDGKWKRPEESFEVKYERANGIVKEQFPGESRWGIQCRCRTDLVDKDKVSRSDYGGDN